MVSTVHVLLILMHAQVNISYLQVHLQPPGSLLVENIHFFLTSIG